MDDVNERIPVSRFPELGPMSPTKEKILQTAIHMFSKQGYSAVSIRDMTKEVGIKESSLYNHFRNKEEILDAIFTLFEARYRRLIPPLDNLDVLLSRTTLEAFLTQGNQLYMDLMNDEVMAEVWRIVHMEQYRNPRAQEIFLNVVIQDTLTFLEGAFQSMIRLGYVKSMDAALLASEYQYPVFALATEYNMRKFQGEDTKAIEARYADHVRFFSDAVGNCGACTTTKSV